MSTKAITLALALALPLANAEAQVGCEAGRWVRKNPSVSPPPLQSAAMVYDAARRETVLFGGGGDTVDTVSDSTWTWNGDTWTLKTPTRRPSRRVAFGMAYDAARGVVVLFGGAAPGEVPLGDTWVWNGTDWTQIEPASAPSPRFRHSMVYDPLRRQVLLQGGQGGNVPNMEFTETWLWDGANWTQKFPEPHPYAFGLYGMAFDSQRGEAVMVAGHEKWDFNNQTWIWNGTSWANKTPASSPLPRFSNAVAYDAARGQVVLFGGWGWPNGWAAFDDTWTWDGGTWTQLSPPVRPQGRNAHVMAYDEARQETVMFGGWNWGTLRDTWVWGTCRPTGPAKLWVGLKNSDDQGTQFDLRVEFYKNQTTLLSAGKTLCVTDVTRNPSLAKQVEVAFDGLAAESLNAGDQLSISILTRIGTNPDGTKCSGPGGSHNNAVGLRLYYDASNRPSRFASETPPNPLSGFFLHSGTTDYFDTTAPTGPTAKYKDSNAVNFSGGNPWKLIGTWNMTVP